MIPRCPWTWATVSVYSNWSPVPGGVVAEELAVQVERVQEVELGQVREVDAHRPLPADADRVARVVERLAVDGVEVVLAVAVGVEAVHHHHELLRRRTRLLRVDDERAVEALVDVLLQRRGVAVVEVHPRRPRRELVGERVARGDDLEDAVHLGRVDPVEVDRVRVGAAVDEVDAQQVVLGRPDHGPRRAPVVGPGVEEDALCDLDAPVERHQLVLAHAARLVWERLRRDQQVVELVRPAGRRNGLVDHRGMTHRGVVVVVAEVRRAPLGGGRLRPDRLRQRPGGDERRGGREHLLPGKLRHV